MGIEDGTEGSIKIPLASVVPVSSLKPAVLFREGVEDNFFLYSPPRLPMFLGELVSMSWAVLDFKQT